MDMVNDPHDRQMPPVSERWYYDSEEVPNALKIKTNGSWELRSTRLEKKYLNDNKAIFNCPK